MMIPVMLASRAGGGGAGFFAALLAFTIVAIVWCRLLWPRVRRFLFLSSFISFHISDSPASPEVYKTLKEMDEDLKYWPSHLNWMALYFLGLIFAIGLATGFVITPLTMFLPVMAVQFAAQFLTFFLIMIPLVACAGFYRICLRPEEPPAQPQSPPAISLVKDPPEGQEDGPEEGPEER
jgi:hypothetical protein